MKRPRGQAAGSVFADILKAGLAGATAVWAMDRFDWFAFKHEDRLARERTERVRPGGHDPAHALAAQAARMAGRSLALAPPHQHPAGLAVHYAIPIGLAWLYLVLRRRLPLVRRGGGALYGIASFVVLDQAINPVLGLAADPRRYPWQRNARELTSHMIYGAVTHAMLNRVERISPNSGPGRA
jgi:hypothetical protein